MSERDAQLTTLSTGLDQATRLLGEVSPDDLALPTPCADWRVADLVDHMVAGLGTFAHHARGEDVDWSASTPHVESGWAEAFRAGADDLLAAWREQGEAPSPFGPDWQSAEVAVHTWDLATALGRSTTELDPVVAERGLAFMHASLKPEMRGEAFGPEQPAPQDADAYTRIAAFAGRRP
jgi:uncharacterized protein (TIGR03086 family)